MIKKTLLNFDMLYLPLIAFLIFFAMFICVLVWVQLKQNQPLYRHMGELPFKNDEDEYAK